MTQTSGIEGIDAITYSTERWDDARKFFSDWGLKALADEPALQAVGHLASKLADRFGYPTLNHRPTPPRVPNDPHCT